MNESLKPAVFKVADQPAYRYVVMPFRVNQWFSSPSLVSVNFVL
jgi:hypothetical protein